MVTIRHFWRCNNVLYWAQEVKDPDMLRAVMTKLGYPSATVSNIKGTGDGVPETSDVLMVHTD